MEAELAELVGCQNAAVIQTALRIAHERTYSDELAKDFLDLYVLFVGAVTAETLIQEREEYHANQ
jgi:hypothetical protein